MLSTVTLVKLFTRIASVMAGTLLGAIELEIALPYGPSGLEVITFLHRFFVNTVVAYCWRMMSHLDVIGSFDLF